MKKPLDRINQAYYGELGENFSTKVRNRIHWICENAYGEDILDVGCSQGITSIILGREGKSVLGIDSIEESIQYAQEALECEELHTRNKVLFEHNNFMTMEFDDQLFDTIIFGEVLEHITDPKRFIFKAKQLLKAGGRIIVTLPFGINDYFDHKKTYYLVDVFSFEDDSLSITKVKFFGKWIGFVFEQDVPDEKRVQLNTNLIKSLEETFYHIERDLIERNNLLNQQYNEAIEENQNLIEQIDKVRIENQDFFERIEKIRTEKQNLSLQIDKLRSENQNLINEIDSVTLENQRLIRQKNDIESTIKQLKFNYKSALDEIERESSEKATYLEEKQFLEEKLVSLQEEVKTLKAFKEKTEKNHQEYKNSHSEILKLQNKIKTLTKSKSDIQQLQKTLKEKIEINEKLYESYEKEARLLKNYNKLMKRYEALSNSKLGRIQLAYWRRLGERRRQKSEKSEDK